MTNAGGQGRTTAEYLESTGFGSDEVLAKTIYLHFSILYVPTKVCHRKTKGMISELPERPRREIPHSHAIQYNTVFRNPITNLTTATSLPTTTRVLEPTSFLMEKKDPYFKIIIVVVNKSRHENPQAFKFLWRLVFLLGLGWPY